MTDDDPRAPANIGCNKSKSNLSRESSSKGSRGVFNGTDMPGDDVGVGGTSRFDDGSFETITPYCTASEIAKRCLLTAAHCQPQKKADFYSPSGKRKDFIHHVIPFERILNHPNYVVSDVAGDLISAENDLTLVWTKPFETDGHTTEKAHYEIGTVPNWNPRAIDIRKLAKDEFVHLIGYAATVINETPDQYLERGRTSGVMFVWHPSSTQDIAGGYFELAKTIYNQAMNFGDSGGPTVRYGKREIVGVNSRLSPDPSAANARSYDTDLSVPGNSNFVLLETTRPAKEKLNSAEDFCRRRVPVIVDFEGDGGTDGGTLRILGSAPDPMKINPPQTIDCSNRNNNQNVGKCNFEGIKMVKLEAKIAPNTKFIRWQNPPEKLEGVCPCGNDPICEFDVTTLPEDKEYYGYTCVAEFEGLTCKTGFDTSGPGGCAPCCTSLLNCPDKYQACIDSAVCKDTNDTCE